AGVCGPTRQAVAEAAFSRELGYHAGLLSLGALQRTGEDELLAHCRAVAEIIPLFGFYLQPAAGGRVLPYSFWRRFAESENGVAVWKSPTPSPPSSMRRIRTAAAHQGVTRSCADRGCSKESGVWNQTRR